MKKILPFIVIAFMLSGCSTTTKEEDLAYDCMQKLRNLDIFNDLSVNDRRTVCGCIHNPDGGLICKEFRKDIKEIKSHFGLDI